jgi:hypothetical protein
VKDDFAARLDKALNESLQGESWITDTGLELGVDDTNHTYDAFWSAVGIDPDEHTDVSWT